MDNSARGLRATNGSECDLEEGLKSARTLLVIKLPNTRVVRIMARSVFLAMLLIALPSLGLIVSGAGASSQAVALDFNGFKILPILLHDLVDEGLIKKGQKGFVPGDIDCDFDFLRENGIDFLTGEMKVVEHQVFDFVFAPQNFQLIDSILKEGGLVISLLGHDSIKQLKNYKIVYLRQFENTVVAMRKMGGKATRKQKQVFCGVASDEQKKAALKGLEDVYLEPPRRATLAKKSRKIKFLPDLLKDTLGGYPRRVFISDDSTALNWFYKNYPMRDQEFQVYDVANSDNSSETSELGIAQLKKQGGEKKVSQETGVSAWLAKHVRREDYVVMKAEARVVEEMLKEKTLNLVDELFLECKHQWQHGGEEKGSKRAYWQCLALYGKVRDEGIAVHQWWG